MRMYARKKELINSIKEALGPKIGKKLVIVGIHMPVRVCLKLSALGRNLL